MSDEIPLPARPDDIEEIKAFCFVAGFELRLEGQAWTDSTGIIRGSTWKLWHIETARSSTFDGYPSMATIKRIVEQVLSGKHGDIYY